MQTSDFIVRTSEGETFRLPLERAAAFRLFRNVLENTRASDISLESIGASTFRLILVGIESGKALCRDLKELVSLLSPAYYLGATLFLETLWEQLKREVQGAPALWDLGSLSADERQFLARFAADVGKIPELPEAFASFPELGSQLAELIVGRMSLWLLAKYGLASQLRRVPWTLYTCSLPGKYRRLRFCLGESVCSFLEDGANAQGDEEARHNALQLAHILIAEISRPQPRPHMMAFFTEINQRRPWPPYWNQRLIGGDLRFLSESVNHAVYYKQPSPANYQLPSPANVRYFQALEGCIRGRKYDLLEWWNRNWSFDRPEDASRIALAAIDACDLQALRIITSRIAQPNEHMKPECTCGIFQEALLSGKTILATWALRDLGVGIDLLTKNCNFLGFYNEPRLRDSPQIVRLVEHHYNKTIGELAQLSDPLGRANDLHESSVAPN